MRGLFLMLAWLTGAGGHGLDLGTLPAPATGVEMPSAEAGADFHSLDHTVTRLVPGAKLTGARYFRLGQSLGFQPVIKQIANLALEHKATPVSMPARRPGYDLIDAWRVNAAAGLAVVMAPGNSGHPLVAYFALKLD